MEMKHGNLVPLITHLDDIPGDYLQILGGPPRSVSMCSGLVKLSPGTSVGTHSTKGYEELVIVLEGTGEARISGSETMEIAGGDAVYIPPETEHDMANTGDGVLRYIYVVAKALP